MGYPPMRGNLMRSVLVFVLAAALLVPASVAASNASPVSVQVATWIAGHPVSIVCDADVNPSPVPTAPGFTVTAWTFTGGNVIHMLPLICDETTAKIGTNAFADGLATVIHEAARARGLQSDSCVELIADLGVYQALRDFYSVPFFTPLSRSVGAQVLALTRRRPASYQPELCWGRPFR